MDLFSINDPLEALRALEVVTSSEHKQSKEIDLSFITPNLIGTNVVMLLGGCLIVFII